ncbi:dUTP diphosphatase [Psychrobacillus sp. FSL K6-1267]|uniref:dUTP diphosphatase n=1 Tax=Psychrobacillus sp. FSL K6-1267 TaxID=2921543 RepID=UPI0030F5A118
MNLNKLFETQKVLDIRIEKEHPRVEGEERLAKKVLALQVELGELANEQRTWKFWSNDQEPRTKITCEICRGHGGHYNTFKNAKNRVNKITCNACEGTGVFEGENPLLEEYVDCLHFILSIGLELKLDTDDWIFEGITYHSIITQFIALNEMAAELYRNPFETKFLELLETFIGLGEMLGFTWEQIEEAYYEKNEINHERQNTGY